MTLAELMNGRAPDPAFEGFTTADDFVLAVNLATPPAAEPGGYLVAQRGITEHSGTLEAQTQDSQYIRTGQSTVKTGTQRQFALTGDRYVGDAFQDAMLDHGVKYGTGQAVVKDYVYFNILTGKGEKGQVSLMVEDDPSGAAGENAGFAAALNATGVPAAYAWQG